MQAGPLTKLKNSTEYTLRYDFLDVTHSGRNFCINLYNGSLLRFNFSAIEEILSPFARQLATKFFRYSSSIFLGVTPLISLIFSASNLALILNSFTICGAVFPLLSISRISCQSILLCGRPSFLFKPKSPRLRAIVDASTYRISAICSSV